MDATLRLDTGYILCAVYCGPHYVHGLKMKKKSHDTEKTIQFYLNIANLEGAFLLFLYKFNDRMSILFLVGISANNEINYLYYSYCWVYVFLMLSSSFYLIKLRWFQLNFFCFFIFTLYRLPLLSHTLFLSLNLQNIMFSQ